MESLARTWAFERAIQDREARRSVRFRWGTALFDPAIPRVYDANFARVERELESVRAGALVQEVDALARDAGLVHRKMVVPDERVAERLEPELTRMGFEPGRLVVMEYQGSRARPGRSGRVREVATEELQRAREQAAHELLPPSSRDAASQLVHYQQHLGEVIETHLFAAPAEGEVGSFCTLMREGGVAQIEEVTTLERRRRVGLGTAVVETALAAAIEAGDELIFLVADDGDWPKDWYARLGFRAIGRRWQFTRV
jgi:predicted GNAT family acetyltransferase